MNGGPGSSSTFANFLENGPMRITRTGDDISTGYSVNLAEEGSWADTTHIVFLDQPVGTGFSWGEPLLTNMDESAAEFQTWLTNFINAFPEFYATELYITGESYSGKYVPRYSWEVLQTEMASRQMGEIPMWNLRASLVGDPFTAPLTDRMQMWMIPTALNVLDEQNMN